MTSRIMKVARQRFEEYIGIRSVSTPVSTGVGPCSAIPATVVYAPFIATRRHQCGLCFRPIERGEQYVKVDVFLAGPFLKTHDFGFSNMRQHGPSYEDCLRRESGSGDTTEETSDAG